MNTQRIIGAMVWITAILTKSYAKQVPSNFEYTPDGRCPKWLYKHQETCKTDEKLTHIPVTCQESTDGTSGGMVWGFSLDPRHTPCELRKNIGSPDKLADHSLTQTIYTYNKLGFTFTKRGINEFKKRLIRTVQTSIRSMYEHEKYHVQQACPYRQSISNWQLSQLAVMIYPSMSIKSTHAFTEALLATIKSECTSENSIKALSKMHRNQEKYHRQILKRNGKSNKCDRKKLFGAQVMLHDPVGTDVADLKPYLKYKMQQRKNGVQDSEFKEHTALLLDTSINADRINYTYVNPNSIRQIAASEKLGKLHLAEAKLTKDQYMRMLKAMLEYTLRPYPEFIPPSKKINLAALITNAWLLKEMEAIIHQIEVYEHMTTKLKCLKPKPFRPRKAQHEEAKMQFNRTTEKMASQFHQLLSRNPMLAGQISRLFTPGKIGQKKRPNTAKEHPLVLTPCKKPA